MTEAGRKRREQRKYEESARMQDPRKARQICREIRDSPESTNSEKLEAISLLLKLAKD